MSKSKNKGTSQKHSSDKKPAQVYPEKVTGKIHNSQEQSITFTKTYQRRHGIKA